MTLHGSAREEKVDLIVRVAEAAEVLNTTCDDLLVKETWLKELIGLTEDSLAVCNCDIHVMLVAG